MRDISVLRVSDDKSPCKSVSLCCSGQLQDRVGTLLSHIGIDEADIPHEIARNLLSHFFRNEVLHGVST